VAELYVGAGFKNSGPKRSFLQFQVAIAILRFT